MIEVPVMKPRRQMCDAGLLLVHLQARVYIVTTEVES
jgi:hypothetical protein